MEAGQAGALLRSCSKVAHNMKPPPAPREGPYEIPPSVSPPSTWLLPQPDRVTLDSIHYYGKMLYRDVNFRYFFGSIFPKIFSREGNRTGGRDRTSGGNQHKLFDPRLGRCIIHHFPKITFIHVFLFLVPRRPPLFFGRRHRQRRQSRGRPV
jgi:hypothetical protein